jgi:hypothetical protein
LQEGGELSKYEITILSIFVILDKPLKHYFPGPFSSGEIQVNYASKPPA